MDRKLEKIRFELAKYMKSEGCSCCRDIEPHKLAEENLAKMLSVEKYSDDSGYNWGKYIPEENV